MVHVRVGEQHRVDFTGQFGQWRVLIKILALLHTVVDEDVFAADVEVGAASGDFVVRSDEGEFHTGCLSVFDIF